MNSPHCCTRMTGPGAAGRRQRSRWRRVREIAGMVVPGTVLALVPKCPMCLAAYVALGTGFTLSFSFAHLVMRLLTALCIGALAFCVVRPMITHLSSQRSLHRQLNANAQ